MSTDIAFRIVIPEVDSDDFDAVTSTLIETASLLPNTRQLLTEDGTRIIVIAQGDALRYPAVAEKIRQLTTKFEQLVDKRDTMERQLDDFDWDDYHDHN